MGAALPQVNEEKAKWYRQRAADCAAMAKHALDEAERKLLTDMEQTWLRLAETMEKWELE
jgi:hypothetical protein